MSSIISQAFESGLYYGVLCSVFSMVIIISVNLTILWWALFTFITEVFKVLFAVIILSLKHLERWIT